MMIRKKPKPPISAPPVAGSGARARRSASVSNAPRSIACRACAYEIDQEAQIMQAQEAEAENLLLVDEMPDVRAAEASCTPGSRSPRRAGADRGRSGRSGG